MKHLKFKPKKIITIDKVDIDVTKKQKTISLQGMLYIKFYEKGVAIRMRNQGEIILPLSFAGELALLLREYSYPKLYTSIQLSWILQKFKYDKDVVKFVERILNNEVTNEEITKIVEDNKVKEKVVDRLTDRKIGLGSLFG